MWLYNLISVVGVKVPERAFGDSGRSVHGHGTVSVRVVHTHRVMHTPPKY
jgi:hypothetical protein